MDNDNKIVKYKNSIMIQCVSIQAWFKNNPNPTSLLLIDKIEKMCLNIQAWIYNNSNPTTEKKLNEIKQLNVSLNDSLTDYYMILSTEKAKEIKALEEKINDNIFSYCENIISGGWEKTKTILPTKVQEQQEWIDKVQGTHGDKVADGN